LSNLGPKDRKGSKAGQAAGTLFVVSGPSGAGKSTLCRRVVENTGVRLSISATTRPAGGEEVSGRDYYFLSREEFEKKIADGAFLEYARVFDHYYGTPAKPVLEELKAGRDVILEIDVQGAAQVFAKFPEAVGIFILPPGEAELRNRLRQRGREDLATMEKRLAQAQREMEQARQNSRYRYSVVNDDLAAAVREMTEIIENKQRIRK